MGDRLQKIEDRLIAIEAEVEDARDRDDEGTVMELEDEAAFLSEDKTRLMAKERINQERGGIGR